MSRQQRVQNEEFRDRLIAHMLTVSALGASLHDSRPPGLGSGFFLTACTQTISPQLPPRSAMASDSQRQKGRDSTLSRLNLAIDALSLAKDISTIAPAQATFSSVCALLTILRVFVLLFCVDGLPTHVSQDFIANEEEYVELGLHCADICKAIDRGMNGKRLEDLSQSVCEAINQLTMWVQLEAHGLGHPPMTRLITGPLRRSRGR